MISNSVGMAPTKLDCKMFEGQQGMGARILIDPKLDSHIYGNKETFMISNEKGQLVYKQNHLNLQEIENEVIKELEATP